MYYSVIFLSHHTAVHIYNRHSLSSVSLCFLKRSVARLGQQAQGEGSGCGSFSGLGLQMHQSVPRPLQGEAGDMNNDIAASKRNYSEDVGWKTDA